MKVVLDTNVLVSSLLANGPPAAIVDLVAEGKLTPFYDDFIISEYWRVLIRPKFKFHPSRVSRLIDDIVRIGIAVEANISNITPMPDEEDRKFYDVAKSSGAFLITGNIKHFPSEPFVVTPADFLRIQI
jgi:putative PIN family toxin of toxin-antitoxin system